MPFENYGSEYGYKYELPMSLKTTRLNGLHCAGIEGGRRGANYHAWENDMVMGFGIRHYAAKWQDTGLRRIADGIRNLLMQAPRKEGAFPCVYNFAEKKFEGTVDRVSIAADPYNGYDTAAMGVTAWWMLHWNEHFGTDPELLERATSYAWFLRDKQLESGAIPTWFYKDLAPAKALRESATTAISGAVLARIAQLNGDPSLAGAAIRAGRFVDSQVLPELKFHDFETFYSCSFKPYGWRDPVSTIEPQNTLSVQWAADQFLALFKLTGDDYWLKRGEYALDLLSFYQQVWAPPYYRAYVFGGFGVMNTDGEWNDGRQSRFVHTYADYYEATGTIEYLERAVSACRASFAQMDIPENHDNGINFTVQKRLDGKMLGYATENMYHDGPGRDIGGWSGFNWGAGGGLAASAYLERKFGSLWIDCHSKKAVPVDGLTATVKGWGKRSVRLEVTSALADIPSPFKRRRKVTVRFGRMDKGTYNVAINGKLFKGKTADQLGSGLTLRV